MFFPKIEYVVIKLDMFVGDKQAVTFSVIAITRPFNDAASESRCPKQNEPG
jgi:hypothetical protein